MSHFLTDYFAWLFVLRSDPEVEPKVELWRVEEPRGDLTLYMSSPEQTVSRALKEGRPLTRSEHTVLTTIGPYSRVHARWGNIIPLCFLDRDEARVLCNELCVDRCLERGDIGDRIYRAALQAFCTTLGVGQRAMTQDEVQGILERERHIWALAGSPGSPVSPPKFKLVAVDRFFEVVYVWKWDYEVTKHRATFDFTGDELHTSNVMELDEADRARTWGVLNFFPADIGALMSALGAVAQCGDPYRFETLKSLIGHAADLGWQARHRLGERLHGLLPSATHQD